VTSPFVQKASTNLKSAKMLLDAGDADSACNRAYYAMYDAARACLAWASVAPERGAFKTHQGLIAAFGLHLVKPGLFPADIGRLFQSNQFLRQVADYDELPVSQEQAELALAAAEKFVSTAVALIAEPRPGEL
jgi:uncharacterized protein (UPF0332 family)